jgi:hypothetical protein
VPERAWPSWDGYNGPEEGYQRIAMTSSIILTGPAADIYDQLPEPERARIAAAVERLVLQQARKGRSAETARGDSRKADAMSVFLERLPAMTFTTGASDFSAEHDHYIYGADKGDKA